MGSFTRRGDSRAVCQRHCKEREDLKKLRLGELRNEIALGSEQADPLEFVDGPEALRRIRRSFECERVQC